MQIYDKFLWIKTSHTPRSSVRVGADPNIWAATAVFNLPIHLQEWKHTKKEMLVLRRMTGQDTELPRRVGHTHATGKSAFVTADLTQPKTVCVSVRACLCLCVQGGRGGRGDTAWHDSHRQKNPDSPAAAWVSPGRCSNSSRKLRECEIKKRNFFRRVWELLVQLSRCVWKLPQA